MFEKEAFGVCNDRYTSVAFGYYTQQQVVYSFVFTSLIPNPTIVRIRKISRIRKVKIIGIMKANVNHSASRKFQVKYAYV